MANEIGRVGLKRYGGTFYEEFLPELQGLKGIHVYKEMSENDDVVGSILFAIKMLIRQATWSVQPASEDEADVKAAEFVESCMYDMQTTWTDTISDILSFLTYGWSLHEIVYKRRMGRKSFTAKELTFIQLNLWRKIKMTSLEKLKRLIELRRHKYKVRITTTDHNIYYCKLLGQCEDSDEWAYEFSSPDYPTKYFALNCNFIEQIEEISDDEWQQHLAQLLADVQ